MWPTLDRIRLQPGDQGVVTRIEADDFVYIEDGKGGLHWQCIQKVE